MGRKRKVDGAIIVPNKLFKELWIAGHDSNDMDSFVNKFISIKSDSYVDYTKHGFDILQFKDFLKRIYEYSHLSFRDILVLTGYGITEFSDAFCIPLQTVKTWASPKGSFASYQSLTYLRYFGLLEFENVMIEEEIKRYNSSAQQYGSKIREVARILNYFDESDKFDLFKHSVSKDITSHDKRFNTGGNNEKSTLPQENISPIKRGPLYGLSTEESIERLSNHRSKF